jgi:microcystin-dependent protein
MLNTNPVSLDANGCALMYGGGTYRQILYDNLQNVVWDRPTTTPPINPVWAGTATGTANAILASAPGFGFLNGQGIDFIAAFTNTGPTTVNGFPLVTNGSSGTQALPPNDIIAGNLIQVVWSQTAQQFYLINGAIPPSLPAIHYAGQVIEMRTQTCPAGTLPEDGTSYLATSYVALFNAIGYTWGGSGANFNVPNAGGQFNRGWETGQAVDSGRAFGTTQLDEMQTHTHNYDIGGGSNNIGGGGTGFTQSAFQNNSLTTTGAPNSPARIGTETRPTNITALSCIVTGLLP